jgi:hypothetical protein
METYIFNADANQRYKDILFQQGGAPPIDRYIFNAQDGDGIASFFGPLLKYIVPFAKSIGRVFIKNSIPLAKTIGREAIKGGAEYGISKLADKAISRKRKRTTSVKAKPYKRI